MLFGEGIGGDGGSGVVKVVGSEEGFLMVVVGTRGVFGEVIVDIIIQERGREVGKVFRVGLWRCSSRRKSRRLGTTSRSG